jgi:hypothetical protein
MALAVQHPRDELARNDQALHDSIAVEWSRLEAAQLRIDEGLELRTVTSHGDRVIVSAEAHLLQEPLALVVRALEAAGSSDGAGQAIASLFVGDRQKVAWAWAAMWQRAEAGREASGVFLSEEDEDAEGGAAALLRLKGHAATRRRGRVSTGGKLEQGEGTSKRGEVVVRRLKDIALLQPDAGTLVNQGKAKPGVIFPMVAHVSRPGDGAGDDTSETQGAGAGRGGRTDGTSKQTTPVSKRTVPAPVDDREQLAFDAVRSALALDPPEIRDLRRRRGIGADAMDDLSQLFEIKMSSGELSNEVTLKRSQAEAALDPDFFLAVVSGLDEGDVPLTVRFIFDPLRRLQQRITGDVTLTGIRDVEALEYSFGTVDPMDQSSTEPVDRPALDEP